MNSTAPRPSAAQPTEEDIARIIDSIYRHPRHRELLYKTLAFCHEERDEREVERFIEQQPEYARALQESFALIRQLVTCDGLTRTTYDEEGTLLDSAHRAELTNQGFDDDAITALEASYTVVATSAGRAAMALLDPARRIAACTNAVPSRRDAFVLLLEYCRKPRSLDSMKQLLDGHPALEPSARSGGQRLHAVFLIDRLDEAGGLVWNGSWVTTEAGKRFLATV